MKVQNQFGIKVYRITKDDDNSFSYGFKVEDEENNMYDFYLMCLSVVRSIVNNKMELYNINDNFIKITNDDEYLEALNTELSLLIHDIEKDRRQYNECKMDINDYIKMRDRKNKIKKILDGN